MLDHPYNSHLISLWFSSLLQRNLQSIHNLLPGATLLLCSRTLLIHPEIQLCIPAWCLGFSPSTMILCSQSLGVVYYSVELLCSLLFTLFHFQVFGFSLFLLEYIKVHLACIFLQTHCPFASIILILFLSTVAFATTARLLHLELWKALYLCRYPVTAETAG